MDTLFAEIILKRADSPDEVPLVQVRRVGDGGARSQFFRLDKSPRELEQHLIEIAAEARRDLAPSTVGEVRDYPPLVGQLNRLAVIGSDPERYRELKAQNEKRLCAFCQTAYRHDYEQLCFDCYFWMPYLIGAVTGDPASVRISGVHYTLGRDDPCQPAHQRGFGGARYAIRFSTGRRVVTHDLWCQGEIPARLRDLLPDNANFVQETR